MGEDIEFVKIFVETALLSEICEHDTVEGNHEIDYPPYERGRIDALRQVLKIINFKES